MSIAIDQVCAVCARPLTRVLRRGAVVGYQHFWSEPDGLDHLVVPVDPDALGEVRGRCDFCNANQPTWILPAQPYVMGRAPNGASVRNAGPWAACSRCASFIERNEWNALIRYVVENWAANRGAPPPPNVETYVGKLYRQLRKNITGSLQKVQTD